MKIDKYPIDEHLIQSGLDLSGYDPLASEHASEQDRKWFEVNQHRTHRSRQLIDGEFPKMPADTGQPPNVTIVRQLESGIRQRFPISIHVVIRHGSRQITYSMPGPEDEDDVRQLLNNLIMGGGDDR